MSNITDFHAWCFEQADLVRTGKYDQIDKENLIEEIESMGRHERDKLTSALRILFMHLLKYEYQPDHRIESWLRSIKEQRRQVARFLSKTPSLKSSMNECVEEAYDKAIREAANETKMDEETFLLELPYDLSDALTQGWLP